MSSAKFAVVMIPDHLEFDDLHMRLNPLTNSLEIQGAPLWEILQANPELVLETAHDILDLMSAWYGYLRLDGYRHEVAEQHIMRFSAAQDFGIDRVTAGPNTTQ